MYLYQTVPLMSMPYWNIAIAACFRLQSYYMYLYQTVPLMSMPYWNIAMAACSRLQIYYMYLYQTVPLMSMPDWNIAMAACSRLQIYYMHPYQTVPLMSQSLYARKRHCSLMEHDSCSCVLFLFSFPLSHLACSLHSIQCFRIFVNCWCDVFSGHDFIVSP